MGGDGNEGGEGKVNGVVKYGVGSEGSVGVGVREGEGGSPERNCERRKK